MRSIGKDLNIPNSLTKILILPTLSLKNLVYLKVDFMYNLHDEINNQLEYIIDQQTFENIHQSCPLLESLSIKFYSMNVSNEYYKTNNIIPAHCLKNITIRSNFYSPYYFFYLTTKFPYLESLSLYISFDIFSSKEMKNHYQNSLLNMLSQLPSLKRLCYEEDILYDTWFYYEFFKRLNLESNQFTNLEYRYPITKNKLRKPTNINGTNINYNDESSMLLHQFNYLNYLTSLALDVEHVVDLTVSFLLGNQNKMIVSPALEELKMEYKHGDKDKYIYIYDWLDVFPNMILLKINNMDHMIDNSDFIYDYINVKDSEKENNTYYELHQLINKRRLQQQTYNPSNKFYGQQSIYNLKLLQINSMYVWFKNGFDELLKKCCQLKC